MRLSSTTPQPVSTNSVIHLTQAAPVSFSGDDTGLLVRRFKVDMKAFRAALEAFGPNPADAWNTPLTPIDGEARNEPNGAASREDQFRNFFSALGVDLDPTHHPGKTFFFKDSDGTLLVRATKRDLDLIEAAIVALNTGKPQNKSESAISRASFSVAQSSPMGSAVHSAQATAASSSDSSTNLFTRNLNWIRIRLFGLQGRSDAFAHECSDTPVGSWWQYCLQREVGLLHPPKCQLRLSSSSKRRASISIRQQSPGKAVFFNDREGTLVVRATSRDLDLIEAAIETLNIGSAHRFAIGQESSKRPRAGSK